MGDAAGTTSMPEGENARLRQRITELEQQLAECQREVEELQRNQLLLYGVIDTLPAVVFVKDFEGQAMLANQQMVAALGISREVLLSQPDSVLFPAEVVAVFRAHEEQVRTTRQAIELEEDIVQSDGTSTYWTTKFPIFDTSGEIYAVGGISLDITAQKKAEQRLLQSKQALQESQYMLRLIIDNIPQTIFWKDQNLAYLGCNDSFARSAGLASPAEIVGRNDFELPWSELAERYNADDRQVMESDTPKINFEEPFVASDGTLSWVISTKIPLHDSNGVVTAVLGMFEDITERKQAEERLRTFYTLAENAPDGFAMTHLDGTVGYANRAFRDMFGYGDEIIGVDFSRCHPEYENERTASIVEQILEHGTWQGIRAFRRKDSTIFDGYTSVFTVYDTNGQRAMLAEIIRDITEQQRMEAERIALQQQIIEAQQAALRELSTPLIPIADKVVIMPLIGSIDVQRAEQIMETLLEGVASHQAEVVIIDITGVEVVDTHVANAFLHAAKAVKLLGAKVMITGIQPQIAQTLVQLGVELSGIDTQSSLQHGVAVALSRLVRSL